MEPAAEVVCVGVAVALGGAAELEVREAQSLALELRLRDDGLVVGRLLGRRIH